MAFWELTRVSPPSPLELCYKGTIDREGRGFPVMGIHFVGGVELVVNRFGMFWQVTDDVFYLAVVRSNDASVIGMMAQQGYNVGYDLKSMTSVSSSIVTGLISGNGEPASEIVR
ncbi:unnamed protein product [Linum tenue]|uniref:Xylanase inhibitor C-terminal domain-containing protein n=1 Tax=Linum tenue TaxID=586396 RepID=A0AAV0HWM7_9ROSI|nr:unnamed protein product [Linum tenue]